MGRALKVVGRLEQIAKEMATAGYMEVNPDTAHELRMFECGFFVDEPGRRASEIMRKRELEAGIMTWVKFEALEAMYLSRKAWTDANRIAALRLRAGVKKEHGGQSMPVGVTVTVVGAGGGSGSSMAPTMSAAPGTVVTTEDGPQHRTTDVHPNPPLDWKNDIKRFDPFKGFEVERGGEGLVTPAPDSGPLGKTFQPPTANGKSSWPWAKW